MSTPELRQSNRIWTKYFESLVRQKNTARLKEELSRALQSLSSDNHVELVLRLALLEFEFGSANNARVLLEDLIASNPKRSDLWFVYIDQEIKLGQIVAARNLYSRMTGLQLSTKTMKTVFKKFLAFEVQYGSTSTQESVRQRAKDYVNLVN